MIRPHRIVIVDDEQNIGLSLRLILEREGYVVTVYESGTAFHAAYRPGCADLYLVDVKLPDANGLDLLKSLRQDGDPAPVIMISGHGTIRDAVDATRSGAFDFLEKPLARDRVLLVIAHAFERSALQHENQRFREIVGEAPKLIGRSEVFRRAVTEATQVAKSDAGVLLTGESGTGKELLAAHVHRESPLASRPFIKVNCAAIPTELIESELFGHEKGAFTGAATLRRGRFELADGGTIFLDEVGDLHEASQAKLLRVLQDGECQRLGGERAIRVSVRVISATNRHLEQLVSAGRFRQDLYYRLSVVPIRVPALRERREDIGELAPHFLAEFCTRNNMRHKTLGADVVPALAEYDWPGNVRELKNTVERMAILTPGDEITLGSIPFEIRHTRRPPTSALQDVRATAERERIERALDEANGNVSGAARTLGVERTALHKRIRSLGIDRQK
jgi:two-component system, NtrC family, nitrogen regulation response regulator NtrX